MRINKKLFVILMHKILFLNVDNCIIQSITCSEILTFYACEQTLHAVVYPCSPFPPRPMEDLQLQPNIHTILNVWKRNPCHLFILCIIQNVVRWRQPTETDFSHTKTTVRHVTKIQPLEGILRDITYLSLSTIPVLKLMAFYQQQTSQGTFQKFCPYFCS